MCYHHHIWLVSAFWVYKKTNRATEQIWQHENPSIVCLDTQMLLHSIPLTLVWQNKPEVKRSWMLLFSHVSSENIWDFMTTCNSPKVQHWKPCMKYRPRTYHTKTNWSKQIETCSNACSFQKMLVVMLIWRKSFPMNCHQFYSLWQTHQDLYGDQTKQFLDKFFSQWQLWKISFKPHISNHVW